MGTITCLETPLSTPLAMLDLPICIDYINSNSKPFTFKLCEIRKLKKFGKSEKLAWINSHGILSVYCDIYVRL